MKKVYYRRFFQYPAYFAGSVNKGGKQCACLFIKHPLEDETL